MKINKILSLLALCAVLISCGVSKPKVTSTANIITGSVRNDSGQAMEGVIVSDGVCVVKTDSEGNFEIPYDRASGRFVFVSTPSGYRNASFRGPTCFYQDLTSDKKVYDFVLIKNEKNDLYNNAIVFADPQIADTLDLIPFAGRLDDMKEHVESLDPDAYNFGICLGDIVGWQHALYPRITKMIDKVGIDMRYVIGNHDMTNWGRSYETSFKEYEKFFGPTYYSFNVGKTHYVVLDDNFYVGRDYFYIGYLDERQLSWLEKDLATVPTDHKLVLCMHIPTTQGKEDRDRFMYDIIGDNLCNKPALYKMISGFDALILSGHMHTNTNFIIGGGKGKDGLMEHNLGGFCGCWWCGTVCVDGCPPGYKVYTTKDGNLNWYYKSCGYAPDFQGKLYLDNPDYPGLAVAHVWDYDDAWKVEYFEDGVKICDMERFSGKDPVAKAEFADPSKYKISWVACYPSPNMFKAPFNPNATKHIVKITDRFGRIHYLEN